MRKSECHSILAPFSRAVAERSAAGDPDGVLDGLEVLLALPVRTPAMARLRDSVAARFPGPGPGASSEARLRALRFRALAGPPGPATLPAPPDAPPSRQATALGGPQVTIDAGVEVVGLALDAEGRRLVVLRSGHPDRAYALPSAQVLGEFDSFAGSPAGSFLGRSTAVFSPDGARLATGSVSDTVRLFDTADWSLIRDLRAQARKRVDWAAFAPDGEFLLVGQEGRLLFYDADGGRLDADTPPYDDLFGRIASFSRDGRLALIEGAARRALNLPARRVSPLFGTLKEVHAIDGAFRHAAVGPYGSRDGTLVDLRGPDPVRLIGRSPSIVTAFSADGRTLVDGTAYRPSKYGDHKDRLVFRRAPGWEVVGQVGVSDPVTGREDRPVAGGSEVFLVMSGRIAVVDTEAFRARTRRFSDSIAHHALSADGRTLALVEGGKSKSVVKVWRLHPESDGGR